MTDHTDLAKRAKVRTRRFKLLLAFVLGIGWQACFEDVSAQTVSSEQSSSDERSESRRLSPEEIRERGVKFRAELEKAFKMRQAAGKASHVNDLTAVVLPYISPGMAFDDAEDILRAAGFTVPPRPGARAEQDQNRGRDWYAVVAEIPQFVRSFPARIDAYVTLLPDAPYDYRRVKQIEVTIYIQIS